MGRCGCRITPLGFDPCPEMLEMSLSGVFLGTELPAPVQHEMTERVWEHLKASGISMQQFHHAVRHKRHPNQSPLGRKLRGYLDRP